VIQLGLQNAGGHRAHEVFHFCRANPGLVPSFGKRVMAAPYHWSKLKRLPGTSRMLPGDVRHLNVNTTYFKNAVSTALRIAPGDPGGISLYCEFPEDYTKHLTAEYLGEDGYWECPPPWS
jgi:hypothetical protein